MKLSFVIPAYNEENYIGKCLESIERETKGKDYDIEVVVVNNASVDKTKEVASSFEGVIVVDEMKKGLVSARKAGFHAATGDLIANIDSDTILTPGWIDKVMREFSHNGKLVGLSGPFIYYDLSPSVNFWVRIWYAFGFVSYIFNRYVFKISSMLQGGNFVIKKDAFEQVGGYNNSFDFWGEDTDVARRLHKVGEVKFTFKLPIYASGRRLQAEGIFSSAVKYTVNYVWTLFFKKPFNKTFTDIRFK